ncbi:helix-turn-helix transcriptional regulator [Streptacidiphilus jiangxiensis]|uniref:MarR family protein n=1 Tax=Streptacidiphilus jiangxiensis TaxID=235985 RepID=A0A1H7H6Y2_STRJI|nr:helix-turn-helix domain-containing protein [Streptacidiphilus jiangxiensis]SEK45052.1 MarR family protein [Streptacidiphilus jiangxiensis]
MDQAPERHPTWTFLTNHARVLVQISKDPGMRVRDIAARCLLTERAVQRIITDLEQGGYLTHTRVGRTNLYRVTAARPLRHPADAGPSVADLLALLSDHAPGSDAPTDTSDGAADSASGAHRPA